MKTIILSGANNTGKTKTLNIVYQELVKRHGNPTFHAPLKPKNDFECVFEIDNKKIVIYSAGDFVKTIRHAVTKYRSVADILIIPNSNFRQGSFAIINRNSTVVVPLTKTENRSAQDEANKTDANRVLSALASLLNFQLST